MQALTYAVRGFCVVAFLTGGLDVINGVGLLVTAGAPVRQLINDAVLNSQVRFWGVIWFGFGIVLWRSSSKLRTDPGLFKMLCYIIAASGFARLVSAIAFGLPGSVLTGAMVLELSVSAGFLFWHASAMRHT